MTGGEIAIIGGGGWGTALALYLSRVGHPIRLWVRRQELVEEIRRTRENKVYLPGFKLPETLIVDCDPVRILEGVDTIISVVPSHTVREVFSRLKPHVRPGMAILSATKGIENETCLAMSSVISEVLGEDRRPQIAALSGPTFALEVARGDPTAAVVACPDQSLARGFQGIFSGRNLRVYTNTDLTGTEIGGAVKNIVAIAAGIVAGLGFGSNTAAALITRGLAEVKRLCVAAGGEAETLSGLAGLGDLVLTSTSALSRNRSVGIELGKGRKLPDVLAGKSFVAEGVKTTRSTITLARRLKVEMPITEQMNDVLYGGKPPLEAIQVLMERELKSESGS